jgi:serine/threonine protein kinase
MLSRAAPPTEQVGGPVSFTPTADLAPPRSTATVEVTAAPVDPASDFDSGEGNSARQRQSTAPFWGDAPPAKYIKRRSIGNGAYGEAWLVQRTTDGQMFAAKVMNLKDTPEKRRKYAIAEILCLSTCDHPNVIKYIDDSGGEGEEIVIIMELADASDLGTQLRSGNATFSEREAGIFFTQLILALHHIHRRRVIHRDIKSDNIFFTACGLVKIGDFGFSQQYDQTVSGSVAGTFLGSPYYLSPEMWHAKRYGKKTDVWAAGVVLYEILARRHPFEGIDMANLKKAVIEGKIEPIAEVGPEMMELICATLNPDPSRRPSTTQLLAMPLMQHYTIVFHNSVTKHAGITPDVKQKIIAAISAAQDDVTNNRVIEDTEDPRYESPLETDVKGVWKERVMILAPPLLTITLAPGKTAAPGTKRSKYIELNQIKSVAKMDDDDGHYKFGIEIIKNDGAIETMVMRVRDPRQRDVWLSKLHTALEM